MIELKAKNDDETNDAKVVGYQDEYKRQVVISEYISIVFGLACCITSLVLIIQSGSSAAIALLTDSALDILSFITILLLFKSSFSKKNEIKALVVLALLFFISSILVEYDSITSIVYKIKLVKSDTYIWTSFIMGIVFFVLTIYKIFLAKKLNYNSTLLIDIFNTTITFIDCFAMGIGMILYESYPNLWAFDAICGLITGFFIFVYALNICFEIYVKVKN